MMPVLCFDKIKRAPNVEYVALVLASFLIESVCLVLIGGVAGYVAVLPINGLAARTANSDAFTEITSHFPIAPRPMFRGMLFVAFMGLFGGFLPA